MNERILDLLYRSYDGELTSEERRELRDALALSEEFRQEKTKIEVVRRMVSRSGQDAFGPFFAERVMGRVAELRVAPNGVRPLQDWLTRVFRPVAIAGAAVAAGLLVFNLGQCEGVSLASALGISESPIEEMLELPVESILEGSS